MRCLTRWCRSRRTDAASPSAGAAEAALSTLEVSEARVILRDASRARLWVTSRLVSADLRDAAVFTYRGATTAGEVVVRGSAHVAAP